MKKKYMLLSLMSMLGIGMQAQTAYTYVKQNDAVVTADGVAAYSISSGNISIGFDDDNNAVMTNTNGTIAKLDVTEGGVLTADFDNQSGETTSTTGSKTVTVGSAEYGTFYSPFAVQFTSEDDVKVYAPTYASGKLILAGNEIESGTIPAGTGLLLKNAGDITFSFVDAEADEITSGLTGTAVKLANPTPSTEQIYDDRSFILASKNNVVAFYEYVGTNLSAGKAYLMAPHNEAKTTASNAKAVLFDDGTDSIETIESELPSAIDAPAYNVIGQRVNAKSKGMVIINGKKYLNK